MYVRNTPSIELARLPNLVAAEVRLALDCYKMRCAASNKLVKTFTCLEHRQTEENNSLHFARTEMAVCPSVCLDLSVILDFFPRVCFALLFC